MEKMKVIQGFSDYAVTTGGEVTCLTTGNTLKQSKQRGYRHVHIVDDQGNRFRKQVHRLVALAHLPNPQDNPQVNHIDEDKSNNELGNLEWCTPQYNMEYSFSKSFTLTSPDGEVVRVFNMAKFCRENGLNRANLHKVYTGVRQSHKGWTTYKAHDAEESLSQQ